MSASNYTLEDLANGEVVPNAGGPNSFLVRFAENDYDLVGKNAKNRLILEDSVLEYDKFEFGGVTVYVDFEGEQYSLERDGGTVPVPVEKHEHILWSIHDEDGDRLNRIFDELYVPRVRVGLMDMLMPLVRDAGVDVNKTEDGWLLDRDILLSWDAKNHPVDIPETHIVRGGAAVPANTNKRVRDISFSLADSVTVGLPNGTETELDEVEQRFLVSAALIGGATIDGYPDSLSEAVEDSRITAFTDTKSGLYHGHSESKHRIQDLGVTDECADMLWSNANDHTPLHEMALREQELKNAPIDVFEDTPNDDPTMWQKIHSTREKAPIPKHISNRLEEQFE